MNSKLLNIKKNDSLYVGISDFSFRRQDEVISHEDYSKLEAFGYEVFHCAKGVLFTKDDWLNELGASREKIIKLDPYLVMESLKRSVDLNKFDL